ncbi:hypothetical protein [Archaeoglobus sp.]|uniref:hypothetical protein n=1 Tax=Archaeoglobus sp. TaxID=1872626 RepID=UPI0025BCA695|nr:hypothetical protein [Archaeoglobus sp.]
MDRKKFALIGTVLAVGLGGTVGYAVESKQPYLAVIAVIAALVLLRAARGRVDEFWRMKGLKECQREHQGELSNCSASQPHC